MTDNALHANFSGMADDPETLKRRAEIEAKAKESMSGCEACLVVAIKPDADGESEIVTSVIGEDRHIPLLSLGVMYLMNQIQETQQAIHEREASAVPPSSLN